MRAEKKIVQEFYDRFGWQKTPGGLFKDTVTWVDLRPPLLPYYRRVRNRVKKLLIKKGRFFLDAGSGGIPYPEYIQYADGFERHICLDLSFTGLKAAREKLGERGFYIRADIAHLPFRNATFEAFVCNHALYHVPPDEQLPVLLELYRTLSPGATGVIAYTWPTAPLMDWVARPNRSRLPRLIKKIFPPPTNTDPSPGEELPPLYGHPLPASWFHQVLGQARIPYEIRAAQLIDPGFSRAFIRENVWGKLLLSLIVFLEERLPHRLSEKGRYPFIILKKRPTEKN